MSQSDYIKFKRVSTQLKNGKLNPILPYEQYNSFVGYSLETTIPDTKPELNQYLLQGQQIVFGMTLQVDACPSFLVCNNTNLRPNRVANTGSEISPWPLRPLTRKQLSNYYPPKTPCDVCMFY